MPGSRVKKNEEIKQTVSLKNYGKSYAEKGDWDDSQYTKHKASKRQVADITLMIEQMGAMKDRIDKLTDERNQAVRNLKDVKKWVWKIINVIERFNGRCPINVRKEIEEYLEDITSISKDTE